MTIQYFHSGDYYIGGSQSVADFSSVAHTIPEIF